MASMEGNIKPVLMAKMTARLLAETPFTKSYPLTGVDIVAAVAAPGRLTIAGDWNTAKLATNWEMADAKIDLFKHAVKPFTSIRKMDDLTPAILLADTQMIQIVKHLNEVLEA